MNALLPNYCSGEGEARGRGDERGEDKIEKLTDTTIDYTKNNNAGCVANAWWCIDKRTAIECPSIMNT